MSRRFRLPRAARLTDEGVIAKLRTARVVQRGRWFLIRRAENKLDYSRLLVRIAKRLVRAAVHRNRLRRFAREEFRLRQRALPAGDYWVSVNARLLPADLSEARRELERLLCLDR